MENGNQRTVSITGFIITFFGAVLFSTKAIIVKKAFAATSVDALTLLALRMIFSLPFYIVIAITVSSKASNIKMQPKQWAATVVVGLLGYYLSSLFDFLGLRYISAGLERLILFLYPTFAILINALFFKQKISRYQKLALALTYAGIAIAYAGELRIDTGTPHFILGSFLVFVCAVTYSIYIVGSGQLIPQIGATKFTAYAMLAATTGIFVHYLFRGHYDTLQHSRNLWWYGSLLAIFATVLPSFLLSAGMKSIGANNAAIIASIGPVSTIVQAHYFLGEPVFTEQIIGTILVVIGVSVLGWKSR